MAFNQSLYDTYGPILDMFSQDTEEERRRKAAEEATPVTQTIKINPVTGEQKLTISGSPEDFSANNPFTPTITQPGQPVVQQQPQFNFAPQVVSEPTTPVAFNTAPPAMPQMPQPGPATQFAGPATAGAMNQPAAQPQAPVQLSPQELAMSQAAQNAAPPSEMSVAPRAPQPGEAQQLTNIAQGVTPEQEYTDALNKKDIPYLTRIFVDDTGRYDKGMQVVAGRQVFDDMSRQRKEEQAKQELEDAARKGDTKFIARKLTESSPEGSIWKAIMYNSLGLHDAAKREQEKINPDFKWGAVQNKAGDMGYIKFDTNLEPIEGYTADGKRMSNEQLIEYASSGANRKLTTGQELFQDKRGEIYKSGVDQQGRSKLININPEGPEYAGGGLNSYRGQQQVGTAIQKLAIDLQGKGAAAGIKAINDLKKERVVTPDEERQIMDAATATGRAAAASVPNRVPNVPAQANQPVAPAGTTVIPRNEQVARDEQSLNILREEQRKAQERVAAAKTPEEKRRAEADVAGATREIAVASKRMGGTLAQARNANEIAKEAAIAENKPAAEAKGKQAAKIIQQQAFADNAYPIVSQLGKMIEESTGSGIGAKADDLARIIGSSPKGAQAIAQIETFASPLVSMVPRFEGSQSDRDVQLYQKQAGDFANPKLPIKERLAALQGMVKLMKIYDKEGNNDWSKLEPKTSEVRKRADEIIGGGR